MIEVTIRNGIFGPNLGVFQMVALPSAGDKILMADRTLSVIHVEHSVVGRSPGHFDQQEPTACVVVEFAAES